MTKEINFFSFEQETTALTTFPVKISVRREVPDVPFCDEGIASAISEEQSGTDGTSQSTKILTEKVIKAATTSLDLEVEKKHDEEDLYKQYRALIEAILFASSEPLSFQRIREAIDPSMILKPKSLEKILVRLKDEYIIEKRGVRLVETAEGFLLKTPEELSSFLESVFKNRRGERLSQAAAEVLAIIVHKQPITRAQVESIRGVDCTGTIASLLERGLITSVGKLEAPGRPSLWSVTPSFLTHFGLKDLSEIAGINI